MKARRLLIAVPFVISAILLLFIFWPKPALISPLSTDIPDLSNRIAGKISIPLNLDYSQSTEVASLAPVPHYLLFNLDSGKVYAAKGETDKISPGSFTKLLAAQVALDLGYPDELITATQTSVDKVPTILELEVGEQLKFSDLLRGAIATSANDAAATLAEGTAAHNGINLADFINLMNQKATLLKMANSSFATPDGLDDPTQFSTLVDISRLVENTVENYPEIMAAAVSDRQDIQPTSTNIHHYLPNWNGLLSVYPGVFGLKIAYTENAGHSTIVISERNGLRLAAIVTGTDSDLERDMAAAALLDHGFMAVKIKPANISRYTIKKRYQQWADLAKLIRSKQ